MDLKDVTEDLSNQYNYRIEQRLEEMMRTNPNYKNLDRHNRELILDLIKKYKEKIRKGIKPSRLTVREDKYYLHQNRIKLGLTYRDLEQINKLLESFKE
ncbi:hypothetical protein GW920_02200 [Candidatus Falkowbacteria bacterium]|uniref:Uncharacterized protein n=1 Tax=Candidatus Falkowbacteria bacterium CG10_big_fil_rev_8_21_14_0_10_37_18 TaxID=1974562 RepID=A0A2H0V8U4_9BACT|nr:hypothetical protein [Candidatus Falkowbacteria bacterium]NCQ12526.1 hypothetical protein [Candidatus Falkowbacteria bacterium]OIO05992.1 MAG: hypothetical protein AUJ26_01730 [Candidatus Falkowbacteria bacterium CG1_02_37_21]PIR95512.1 MAG: hypothetical protein COT93_01760 [Candidatus Falkowbacteria bacterium CG10_big_fil_rev_8_21_14_0_10_37_18]